MRCALVALLCRAAGQDLLSIEIGVPEPRRLTFRADDDYSAVARSFLSHLAASEDLEEQEFTKKQITSFEAISSRLMEKLGSNIPWAPGPAVT